MLFSKQQICLKVFIVPLRGDYIPPELRMVSSITLRSCYLSGFVRQLSDDKFFVIAKNGTIACINAHDATLLHEVGPTRSIPVCYAELLDNERLVFVREDGSLEVVNLEGEVCTKIVSTGHEKTNGLVSIPSQQELLVGAWNGLVSFNTATWQQTELKNHAIDHLAALSSEKAIFNDFGRQRGVCVYNAPEKNIEETGIRINRTDLLNIKFNV